jgi:N4-gp56 family major capsid protein
MARTIVGVNDPKAVKKFMGLLALDTSQKSYWNQRFMKAGAMAEVPLQILTDLESDAGEQIFYDLLAELTMAPVEGEDNLEGNEEKQNFYTDSVYIDQARAGVNTGGRMTRKRTLHNLRERARQQQSQWWSRVMDEQIFMYLSGARGINPNFLFPLGYTGRANNAFVAPDSNHRFFGGDATAYNNIDVADKMGLALVDKAVTRAQVQGGGATGIPVLQPCKIDGNETYVMVMHTWQEDDLRKETGTSGWLEITKAAAAAEGRNSPLFKGSLGMYRGVILHSHKNVIRFADAGASANVEAARSLFLGAQAGVVAFGSPGTNMRFDWHEETRDNGDKVVITTSSIFGMKKVNFTTSAGVQDFGVFSLDTACASR